MGGRGDDGMGKGLAGRRWLGEGKEKERKRLLNAEKKRKDRMNR